MLKDLQKVFEKYEHVQDQSIQSIEEIYFKYLRDISNYLEAEFNAETLRSQLWERGLQFILDNHAKKNLNSTEVQHALANLLNSFLAEIIEKGNKAS
ncbi:hypothetical protein [Lysinibacillus sp. K60]|uniref:hypothetical protein n=1 Tax=Lysinibacillus sp. K60 TaxID=2720027 RepID=UPI001C8BC421|nr:hypothetical protein [Lysinibacillus sp. K60]MBX8946038.1 hypothetical protein [Lysinibacillus sp. K60]